MITRWREVSNLFVSRTFSKVYGMAGLRIGVLMGNEEQMRFLRRASSPYNLNSIALACLPAALSDEEYIRTYVQQTLEGRKQLESELENWDVRFWPSRANFVLMYLGERLKPFIAEMRARGILVRDRSSDYGCKDCVRITVGIREHNQRLLTALREVFAELGLRDKVVR
jgi:histidinol-phosphate aminotransferase